MQSLRSCKTVEKKLWNVIYNAKEKRGSEDRMQKGSKEIDDHCAAFSCKYFVTTHIQNSVVYDEYLAMKITKEIG